MSYPAKRALKFIARQPPGVDRLIDRLVGAYENEEDYIYRPNLTRMQAWWLGKNGFKVEFDPNTEQHKIYL